MVYSMYLKLKNALMHGVLIGCVQLGLSHRCAAVPTDAVVVRVEAHVKLTVHG